LVSKHPRLETAWRQTIWLSELEREDVLHELGHAERTLSRGSAYMTKQSAFQARLRLKYSQAAFYPWMSVEPDPSPPLP
jgi:hypothetical protein